MLRRESISPGSELLVFHQPDARRKASVVAAAEATHLLAHLAPVVRTGGPYGDPHGLFYIELPVEHLGAAKPLFRYLGYSSRIEQVRPRDVSTENSGIEARIVKWKGGQYFLESIYEADKVEMRDAAPDRREFILPAADGTLRRVVGYRGDGGVLSRRALPVIDCRLLVNLVFRPGLGTFLDPFAGAGGIVIEAKRIGFDVFSVDSDPIVSHGLRMHGAKHTVADARALPFDDSTIAAVSSEPPYHETATVAVVEAISEIHRVTMPGASICLLAAEHQRGALLVGSRCVGWDIVLDAIIDRKGLQVRVMNWIRS